MKNTDFYIDREGNLVGNTTDNHKARILKTDKYAPKPVYIIGLSQEDLTALTRVGALVSKKPKFSTDKRSTKEIVISKKAKVRHNGDKKRCDISWEKVAVEPYVEPCYEIVENKKEGTIKVLENGEVVEEVFSCNRKDAKYAAWANPDFVL